jgi:hypothetical protein
LSTFAFFSSAIFGGPSKTSGRVGASRGAIEGKDVGLEHVHLKVVRLGTTTVNCAEIESIGSIGASPIAAVRRTSHSDDPLVRFSHRTHLSFFHRLFLPLSFRHDRLSSSRDSPETQPARRPRRNKARSSALGVPQAGSLLHNCPRPSPCLSLATPYCIAGALPHQRWETRRVLAKRSGLLHARPPLLVDPNSRVGGEASFGSHRSLQQPVASIGPTVVLVAAVAASRKISSSLQGSFILACSHPATFQPGLRPILAILLP